MKKLYYTLLATLLALCTTAQEGPMTGETGAILPWADRVAAEMDSLIGHDPLLETSQLGLMVYDLTADSAIYTYNHRQTMRPASTMKLLTAITALDRMGGNYQATTSLLYTGNVAGRTLTGSLYVVGGMDPVFDTLDLRNFSERVKQLGVDTLRGSIVTDCLMKDSMLLGEGWCWDDDNPTLTPLLINGKPGFVERFAAELIRAGVVTDSLTTYEERPPMDAVALADCRHSIDQELLRMMKESDNQYAECVYYQLAASFGVRPARATHARVLEERLIKRLGLDSDHYRLADGCGLSLYNYLSPELLTALLRYAWQRPHIRQHLLPSLPIAGRDGTLRKRMLRTAAEGNVRAKTGTLTGISSLAGYLTTADGHELCFAIINQGVLQSREARNFQDKVCIMLCRRQ